MPEPQFFLKQGDLLPIIGRTLEDANYDPVDLTSATSVTFQMLPIGGPSGATIGGAAVVTDADAGEVTYTWQSGDTDTAGLYLAEWIVVIGGKSMTFPNGGYDLILISPVLDP